MVSQPPVNAWLLMAVGDAGGHSGNLGYDDQVDAYYSWDSKVPNHTRLNTGDPVALWDKKQLLGVSVIEEIESWQGLKSLRRCPKCSTTRIAERKRAEPRYRCARCKHEFHEPSVETVAVTNYRARYDAAWTPLLGALNENELRQFAMHPGDINAMRPLAWDRFSQELVHRHSSRAIERVLLRANPALPRPRDLRIDFSHGFGQALVRVRRGQGRFREHLLATQGDHCAFTGGAPARVLEAGHLYSYAQLGIHYEHGGLLLRRDIHRLFDDGSLAVNPSTLRVDVAADLASYSQYSRLHEQPLKVRPHAAQIDWLGKHWSEHRESSVVADAGTRSV